MNRITLVTLLFALLVAAAIWPRSSVQSSSAWQGINAEPLYSFLSTRGNRLYKIGSTLPKGLSDGPWKNEGVVCYVMPQQIPGTRPIYQGFKSDDWGINYAYTKDANEANSWKGGASLKLEGFTLAQWTNQGPVFYVATTQQPGTKALYRLYAPVRVAGKENSNLISKGLDTRAPAGGNNFYTTDTAKKHQAQSAGWVDQGSLGYVWTQPYTWQEAQPLKTPEQSARETLQKYSCMKSPVKGSPWSCPNPTGYQACEQYRKQGIPGVEACVAAFDNESAQIAKMLRAGCKYFLGRQRNFLCTTDQAFAACESLRKQGKQIKCTRAGKAQD